jgi:hypothetical protein
MRLLPLLLLIPLASAADMRGGGAPKVDEAEQAQTELMEDQADAAAYRLMRARTPATPAMDAEARQYLDLARDLLTAATSPAGPGDAPRVAAIRQGETFALEYEPNPWFDWIGVALRNRAERAVHVAWTGYKAAPFSNHAGDLLAVMAMAQATDSNLESCRRTLHKLWFELPEYAGIAEVMLYVLVEAERIQGFQTAVDLDAADPREVVKVEGEAAVTNGTSRLFRFLERYGDRVTVAPRATIGLARGLLRSQQSGDLYAARRAYEDFLYEYPRHPLVFSVLTELALSHLMMYRGDDYDVGALISATLILDQAELQTAGDDKRVALIAAYRRRVQGWHQDRDLRVARWYRSKRAPFGWIAAPVGLDDWAAGARTYYREVVRRNPTSAQGQAAERELAALPPAAPTVPAK